MHISESIINNLLMEVESLSYRLKNIKQAFTNTAHNGLRERLIYENQSVLLRVKEIFSIARRIVEVTVVTE